LKITTPLHVSVPAAAAVVGVMRVSFGRAAAPPVGKYSSPSGTVNGTKVPVRAAPSCRQRCGKRRKKLRPRCLMVQSALSCTYLPPDAGRTAQIRPTGSPTRRRHTHLTPSNRGTPFVAGDLSHSSSFGGAGIAAHNQRSISGSGNGRRPRGHVYRKSGRHFPGLFSFRAAQQSDRARGVRAHSPPAREASKGVS
jgi:hypothetical protein